MTTASTAARDGGARIRGAKRAMTNLPARHLPDLCNLTETPVPDTVEAAACSPRSAMRRHASELPFFAYRGFQRAVQDQRYNSRVCRRGARTTQLFDLQADPWGLQPRGNCPPTCRRLQSSGLR